MQEHNNLFEVSDQNFESQVLQSELPVLIDFWAEWCPHCKVLAPNYARLSDTYAGAVRFATLNADDNPDVPTRFGVQGLPTLLLFASGNLVARIVGPHPTRLQQRIEQALSQSGLSQAIR
ncbi:thioredoxin family protein [Ktedonospora formicarum]|uniref:Thioredoxin n=1 Tax=Ktedonospora formicarum TaxID=2778364 RepID=A0A8J3HXZ1_9CHLR|nr:thioredoxin domain-containing protein [Ktedonospora formicarum]GHO45794.1 thioredoxin [Ktedonospora formicarum]